jgi:two-component system, NtrC family, sensor histidine kinase HydH
MITVMPRRARRAHQTPDRDARRSANHKIAFGGHALVFGSTILFLLFVAGFTPAMIVMLAWGTGLLCHGYFGVAAPFLRERWTTQAIADGAAEHRRERKDIEVRHARSLEQLSASIAHEIRNPITAARSLVAQMGEDPSSADNVEYARVAIEELDRVERSLSHLLQYAREEDVARTDTRLADVLDSALESFRDRLAKMKVEVTRSLDTDCPLHADPEKLRRVVINLTGNALDAMEESGTEAPQLDIAAGENLAQTEVWLRVRDNGPGVPAADREKIFQPLYTSKERGTGLGLAISRKVVEAHGGSIQARAAPSGGTEIMVVLPKGDR